MNVLSYAAVVFALSFFGTPPSHNTQWLNDYGIAIQAARLAQRPLLVVLENPADAEQRLDAIDGSELGDLLESYELCRVDVTTEYGQKVAASYGATQFPYSVITDRSCRNVLFRGQGKFSAEMWERTLDNFKETPISRTSRVAEEADDGLDLENVQASLFSHSDLASAQAASRQSTRPMLVFVTMPGCFHCERMKSETYQDQQLARAIVQKFESVLVDQTEEPDWVYEQGVTLFPTTLVVGTSGEVLAKLPGYKSASEIAARIGSIGSGRLLSQL